MASGRWGPGLRRGHRRGASELSAFPLLKQGHVGAGGVADGAVAQQGHVVGERWDKAGERTCWAKGVVSVRRSEGPGEDNAWLNQQCGL